VRWLCEPKRWYAPNASTLMKAESSPEMIALVVMMYASNSRNFAMSG
jgi:hypothetical protein